MDDVINNPSSVDTGILVEVVSGPMEGLFSWKGEGPLRIGRSKTNEMTLQLDPRVSKQHAQLEREGAEYWIKDVGSRNGTWLSGGRIAERITIGVGTVFVVGHTPLEVLEPGTIPDASEKQPTRPVVPSGAQSPEISKALQAAEQNARALGLPYLDTRALLAGLVEIDSSEIGEFLKDSVEAPEALMEQAIRPLMGRGPLQWVADLIAADAESWGGPGEEPHPTKRVLTLLAGAMDTAGREELRPIHVLEAILSEGRSLPARILAEGGLKAEAGDEWLSRKKAPPQPEEKPGPPPPEEETPEARAEPAGTDRAPRMPQFEGSEIWNKAKDVAERLREIQVGYHLAGSEERSRILKETLRRIISETSPAKRAGVLRQLRDLFPVDMGREAPEASGEVADAEIPKLRKEIEELRARLAKREEHAANSPVRLSDVIGQMLSAKGDRGGEGADPETEVLSDLYRFAQGMERLIAGIVESFHSRGAEVTRYVIPPYTRDLGRMMQALMDGEEGVHDQIKGYLDALKLWLIASLSGYHQAASQWSVKLIAKINPQAVEEGLRLSRWKDAMGLADYEMWRRYKEIFSDLHVDLVEDQVLEMAARIAMSEFEKLKRRSE